MLLRPVFVLVVTMLLFSNAQAIALSAMLPAQIVAQNQRGPGRGGESRLFQELNLSQDQMQKIQEIRDRYKDQMEQRSQAVRQAQQELGTLMAGTASTSQIREKHRQVTQLRQQLADLRFESMLEMREILSADQRRQLANLMQQREKNSRNDP